MLPLAERTLLCIYTHRKCRAFPALRLHPNLSTEQFGQATANEQTEACHPKGGSAGVESVEKKMYAEAVLPHFRPYLNHRKRCESLHWLA